MPVGKRRSLLRRSGPVGAFCFVCLAFLVPSSYAAGAPSPDPPPLAVAPDPQHSAPVVVSPPREREAPVVQTPAIRSFTPAPAATAAPAPVVQEPPALRTTPPVKKKRPVVRKQKPAPVSSPTPSVSPPRSAPHDVWHAPRAAVAVREVEVLPRGRLALAGAALALVALGGGVILGVGGRTLRAAI